MGATDDMTQQLSTIHERLDTVEGNVKMHNALLFGSYDEHTGEWLQGFAQKLGGAIDNIGDIQTEIKDFVTWIRAFAMRSAIAIVCATCSILAAVVWFVSAHADKVEQVLRVIFK